MGKNLDKLPEKAEKNKTIISGYLTKSQ